MAPRLLILRPGVTAPEIRADYGDYDRWFTAALEPHGVAPTICDTTHEPIPPTDRFDGVIVTGSAKSVNQPESWMEPLIAWLRSAEEFGLPVLGVCYGHQILAAARGGRVELNPEGWEIGAVEIDLSEAAASDPLFEGAPSPLPALATHEDRVAELPPGAVHLAGNGNTPLQAYRIGERIWGVQFHPEASTGLIGALIHLRRDKLEQDAQNQNLAVDGHVDRLLSGLDGFDIRPGRRILDRFVAICRGSMERVYPRERQQ